MSYGPLLVFTVSMASGATTSSSITLHHGWQMVHVEIPTMTSGTDVYFQGSANGTTFRRIYHAPTIANSNPHAVFVNSAVTNCMVDLDHRGYPYMKVELSTAMTATPATFKLMVST